MKWTGLNVSHWLYLALLLVCFGVSYDNIHQLALAQHANGFAAFGLAVAVSGTAALTVYVSVVAKTARLKFYAGAFGLAFAGVSALLQWQHYLAAGAVAAVAIGFGVGLPVMEGMIAILEGLIGGEKERLAQVQKEDAYQMREAQLISQHTAALAAVREQLAHEQAEQLEIAEELTRVVQERDRLEHKLENADRRADLLAARAITQPVVAAPAVNGKVHVEATMVEIDGVTDKVRRNVTDLITLLQQEPVTSAEKLAEAARANGWLHLSEGRTVRRALKLAVEQGLVEKQGNLYVVV